MTSKKISKPQKNRAANSVGKDRTLAITSGSAHPILEKSSDALSHRLRQVIGSESVSSFSRKCNVGEGTLRNILSGARPRTDTLVSIAAAAGVTVDWLSTGRNIEFEAALQRVSDATQATVRISKLFGNSLPVEWTSLIQELMATHGLNEAGAKRIIEFLKRQT